MILTITLGLWIIPTIITLVSLCWALFIVDGGTGYMAGLSNIFALIPALAISCISWIVWGIFK